MLLITKERIAVVFNKRGVLHLNKMVDTRNNKKVRSDKKEASDLEDDTHKENQTEKEKDPQKSTLPDPVAVASPSIRKEACKFLYVFRLFGYRLTVVNCN